jgi:hypothetical protein
MSPRAFLVLLVTAGVLASASADAAGLSPNLNFHSTGPSSTTVLATGRTPGYGPSYVPPPSYGGSRPRFTQFDSNDQFDTNGNINPGGGGGGAKPGKSPNLK